MMTKEIVVERYGPLKYTMGNGGSAASMQQHLLAENYPGLLDGLTTSQVFEDHWTQVQGSLDCRVLMHYFWPTSPLTNPGHASAPPNALFPTAATRQPVWGSQPEPTRTTCAARRCWPSAPTARSSSRPRTSPAGCSPRRSGTRRPTRPASAAASPTSCARSSASPSRPTPRTARASWRSTTSASSTACARCRAGRSRPSSSSTSTRKVGGIDIDGNFVPERTRRRPGRAADRLRDRPRQQRHRRGEDPRDRQPHRRPDGRHGLPPGVPLLHLSRAA